MPEEVDEQISADEKVKSVTSLTEEDQHGSLKHQLLGPSLTKSGQDGVDQRKVAEIIYNVSKGSKFFQNEKTKDESLTVRVEALIEQKKRLEELNLSCDVKKADNYIAELEESRDLTQYVVHLDCDAFYAAVEELDRPELKEVPMAVGKGVLTTCNYTARKFGCRSGMAGFVAMALCPQLICLPLNIPKYAAKAEEIRAILEDYDPRYESASIDEAYLNITHYCEANDMGPDEVVIKLRQEVYDKTHITVSAGIAPNAKIAKIASNKNKPNGQFRVLNERNAIMAFMKDLPCRKVNGIGRVFERELDSIGIKTCGDIYPQRSYLTKLFGKKAFEFLIQTHLGLGRTKIQPMEEYERKSVGTESTFSEMSGATQLRDKLKTTAEALEEDLARTQFKGRTLVLKIKLHTYEVYTRQIVPPKAVCLAQDIYNYALPMLTKLEKEIPNLKLRLMGLRCTNLVSTKKADGADFFRRYPKSTNTFAAGDRQSDAGKEEWQVWPEEEFEEAARQEREDEMNEIEALSQEASKQDEQQTTPAFWECPICRIMQKADNKTFNEHIDYCLSRDKIKEAVRESSEQPTVPKKRKSAEARLETQYRQRFFFPHRS